MTSYYSVKDLLDFLNFNDTLVNSLTKSVFNSFLNEARSMIDTMGNINDAGRKGFFDPTYKYPIASTYMPIDPTLSYSVYKWNATNNNFSISTASGFTTSIFLYMTPTYRLDFIAGPNDKTLLTNPSYNITLLQDSSAIKTKTPLPELSLWVSIVPSTFLEVCTSNVNDFFYQIMGVTDRTIDGINDRCSVVDVNTACSHQTKNIRCACNNSYTNHNADVRNIANVVNNSGLVNTDPWCIYPDCASGMAYKPKALQRRSVCSNISMAGIFANLGDYSDININNTQVTASSHNDTGLNFYGPCTPKCGDGYICRPNPTSNNLECMPIKSTQSRAMQGGDGKKSSPTVKIVFLCIVSVLLVSVFIYMKTKKRKYMPQLVLLFIVLLIVLVVIIVLLVMDKKETYLTTDPICYPGDNTCNDANKSCLFNHCSCNIGYMFDQSTNACVLISNNFVLNLPYLPRNVFAGIYYSMVVVNNEMYALALDCNFKFDGEKWVELQKLPFQLGFHPYMPYGYKEFHHPTLLNLNSNLTSVYNNTIYMFNIGTTMMIKKQGSQGMLYSYDTTNDTWSNVQTEFVWKDNMNIAISAVISGILYVFMTGSIQLFNIDNGKNTKTYKSNIYISPYSQVIKTPDNRIFISYCGYQEVQSILHTFYCCEVIITDAIATIKPLGNTIDNIITTNQTGGWVSFLVKSKYLMFVSKPVTTGLEIKYIDISIPNSTVTNIDFSSSVDTNFYFQDVVTKSQPNNIFDYFSSCVSVCNMNNKIFCMNGIGDIFMLAPNFSGTVSVSIVPCYGVAKYDKPRQNVFVTSGI